MGTLLNRIPGWCLLISSLADKASRTLVDIAKLTSHTHLVHVFSIYQLPLILHVNAFLHVDLINFAYLTTYREY